MAALLTVKPLAAQTVYLEYSDGVKGEINLSKTIENNNFGSLNNPDKFAEVYCDNETNELCWPGGVRLCINALHEKLSLLSLMNRLKIDIDDA